MALSSDFFTRNRQKLSRESGHKVCVLSAYSLMQRSNDTASAFEQEANFWYLTGINESDWWVIIDGPMDKSWLVAPDVDEVHRVFEGGISAEEATRISGIKNVIVQKEAETLLRELAKKHSIVHTLGEHPQKEQFNFVENPAQKKLWAILERVFNSVQDCRKELAQLRAIKQPDEIVAIKKAVKLTAEAFEATKEKLPQLQYEYEVAAEFDYYFKRHGADHGYDPIVAGGKNACTLHYGKNNSKLKKNSLLLIDIGAQLSNYSADITRTYAVGTATKRQTIIHTALENAHQQIIALLKPGLKIVDYQKKVDGIMIQALTNIGLMKSEDDEANYHLYFPHAVSHGLGIDVHDSLGGPTHFQAGMVMTVEPGIYIPQEGIGVRIEDDILITKTGRENLSRRLSTGL